MAEPRAPFRYDPQLTAVANLTTNQDFIADEALPMVPVDRETFKYLEIPVGQHFTPPTTRIGRRGIPNEVEFYGKEQTSYVEDHALTAPIVRADVSAARAVGSKYDPAGAATAGVTEMLDLRKEITAAEFIFDSDNYSAANVEALAGSDRWDDATSDPLRKIMEINNASPFRFNVMVVGPDVAMNLILHDRIIKAYNRSDAGEGRVTLGFVAGLLGLEAIYVGQAWKNAANIGQDVSLTRIWPKSAALMHRSRVSVPTLRGISIRTFAAQFYWPINGQRKASSRWFDPQPGVEGVEHVKVATRYRLVSVAPELGYLLTSVVS